MHNGNLEKDASFFASILGIIVCAAELVAISIYMAINVKKLDEKSKKKRCGYIYEGFDFKAKGRKALVYPILYQLRFILLVYTVLYLQKYMII